MVQEIWKDFHDNKPPLKILTLEEAEVAKVSLNAFVVNKIAFVNFLGQLCDGMDNVNVHNITDAIGLDKRISPYFFNPEKFCLQSKRQNSPFSATNMFSKCRSP